MVENQLEKKGAEAKERKKTKTKVRESERRRRWGPGPLDRMGLFKETGGGDSPATAIATASSREQPLVA